ncbi:LysR family transcriptional regulator [Caballeronia insecticola]|uniref:Transcriptional regulator LysR family n=1 Tax=Caballeronia insecticola TaxID=758793 RepID=R4WGZ8_9BURK|nr:LysR family transcriptional regulator [Caballeronia insecticola]BAN23273.1 transcriptional regulator LysR family [Caballeronia insecticola]
MDTLLSMRVFVTIVEAGSLSAAAEHFSISAPMAGKHLQALEARLDARLMVRTTRRQSLTEIGREYYERCRRILADVDAADALAEAMSATPRGVLRVTVPLTYGVQFVTPAVTEFLAAFPQIAVELDLSNRMADIVEDRFDAAVRIGALADSSFIARPLKPYAMTVCASPAYLARAGTPATPADLVSHECLGFVHQGREAGWRLEGEDDATHSSRTQSARFRANNGQALRKAALAGFGLVLQPHALVEDDLKSGALVAVLQDFLPKPSPAHLVYPRDMRATPKLASFVDFMVARLGV